MKIINLMEDTPGNNDCIPEHGLCFYIETKKHKILMDTGASATTLKNAEILGVDLTKVDTVILSHGHYDHTGGLLPFVSKNRDAKIYMHKLAAGDFYNFKEGYEKYIGIDKDILKLPNLQLLDDDFQIDDELYLFSKITGRKYFANSNLSLKEKKAGKFIQDDFLHEQCLVITDENAKVLLSGCAHNGILNILERYKELYKSYPDMVISGFHMMQKEAYSQNEIETICNIAYELKHMNTKFFTGHCTGVLAYDIMKNIMKDNLYYIHCGDAISFNR